MSVSNVNARLIAVKALCRVECDEAYSNIVLNTLLKEYEPDRNDRALCTSIFYGTLERRITIDYVLKTFVKNGFSKLKPFTLNVLRAGVYQILYMDKIPDSAAVNESVKIIKKSKESYNANFVNAVLRNISRSEITLPDNNTAEGMSVAYSCPEFIVRLLLNDYEKSDVTAFLESTVLPSQNYIRLNSHRTDIASATEILQEQGVTVETTALPFTLKVSGISSVEKLKAYKTGLFYVQDIACQKAIAMLGIMDKDRIFDMCSAPGGKAFTAALSAENVTVVASDLYPHRVELIANGVKRLGLKGITPIVRDASAYDASLGEFDKIICDVPCSGIGVIGRKPDIKYRLSEDFGSLSALQHDILSNADKYLKVGGKLLYSTCTLRKAENEEVVNRFVAEHKGYDILNMHTFFPHTDDGDGFFAAVMQKL